MPRLILATSALLLGVLGAPFLFAPVETAASFGWSTDPAVGALAAAGLLAMALLNWMGRGAIYGGIYGRPIVLANLFFGATAGLGLVGAQRRVPDATALGWLAAAVLLLHAAAFGLLLLGRIGGPPGAPEPEEG